jgi:hypothetical protein
MTGLLAALFVAALAGQAFGCKEFVSVEKVGTTEKEVKLTRCVSKREIKPRGQTAFEKTVVVNLNGSGVNVVAMQIPAGKRLVIEKVTAIVRSPESQRVELNYYTYKNNGGAADRTIHELALEKQASFKDSAVFSGSRNVSVLADEQIGGEHFSVGVSARLVGVAAQAAQAQFTFSGYLEDLPAK